jgi:NADH:ubiquinone oxidoreductase subunit C
MNDKKGHWSEINFMLRKTYYVKLLTNLYKKFIKTLVLKKNENNTLYILIGMANFYNFTLSLRNSSLIQLRILNDICVIDYPEKVDRFELNYNLSSIKYNFRFFIKSYTSAYAPSLSSIFNSAN